MYLPVVTAQPQAQSMRALWCDAQARGDVMTCLVTGNLEPVGWGKMQALGIDHLFTQPR
jgi:hypothetical protein